MIPSILLLDCSNTLAAKPKRQGFDVDSGNIGFCTGIRSLPCQLYERDILVYNPFLVTCRPEGHGYILTQDINNITPEYSLNRLKNHILRGATFLIFVNHAAEMLWAQKQAYSWIEFMPDMEFTKDEKVSAYSLIKRDYGFLTPIVSEAYVKLPVLQKLVQQTAGQGAYVPLLYNLNNEVIGTYMERGKGKIIILPQCQSNEEVIGIFLHRVIPKLYDLKVRKKLTDEFISPEEEKAQQKVQLTEKTLQEITETIEAANEELNSARRKKEQTVKKDETAVRILKYHDLAMQQDDVALFYLYKVIETVEHKCGGEKEAKSRLGCKVEWNLIGKVANVSYADIRHAPKPGEKIKEWTSDEIEKCFKAAEKITKAYLSTLF